MNFKRSKKIVPVLCALLMITVAFQNVSAEGDDNGNHVDIFFDENGNQDKVWRDEVNGVFQVFYANVIGENNTGIGHGGDQVTHSFVDVMYPQIAIDPVSNLCYILWSINGYSSEEFWYCGSINFTTWTPEQYAGLKPETTGNPNLDLIANNYLLFVTWKEGGSLTITPDIDGDLIVDSEDPNPAKYNVFGDEEFSADVSVVIKELNVSVAIDYEEYTNVKPTITSANISSLNGSVGQGVNISLETNISFTAIIKIQYDNESIPEDFKEKYLRMYWLDDNNWMIVKNTSAGEDTEVDLDTHSVWAITTHFSSVGIGYTPMGDSDFDGLSDVDEIEADGTPDSIITTFSDGTDLKDLDFDIEDIHTVYFDVPVLEAGIERAALAQMDIEGNLYTFDERQITSTDGLLISGTSIYEDKVVWSDNRNGNFDIFIYDLNTKTETQLSHSSAIEMTPRIWGDHIIWWTVPAKVIIQNYVTGEEWEVGQGYAGDIYENYIVWPVDGQGIMLYEIDTQNSMVITSSPCGTPHVYGDFVAYVDHSIGSIILYSIPEGTPEEITSEGVNPFLLDIDDGYVIYQDSTLQELYAYDIVEGTTTKITDSPFLETDPTISKNIALWTDLRNGKNIYGYDVETDIEFPVCTASNIQDSPAIYDERIIWRDMREGGANMQVYSSTRIPSLINMYFGDDENSAWCVGITDDMMSTPEFSVALNKYLKDHTDLDDGVEDGYITVPLNISTPSNGKITLSGLIVEIYICDTDPVNPDTDGDNLVDGYEEYYSGHSTDPTIPDCDGDLLSDGEEVELYGCDPWSEYTDGDTLSDYDEVALYGTDPTTEYTDTDNLRDDHELMYKEETIFKSHQAGLEIPSAIPMVSRGIINNVGTAGDVESATLYLEINGISDFDIYFGYLIENVIQHSESIQPGIIDLILLGYTPTELNLGYDWCVEIHSYELSEGILSQFEIIINSNAIFSSPDIGKVIPGVTPGVQESHIIDVFVTGVIHYAELEIQISGISKYDLSIGYIEGGELKDVIEIESGITQLTGGSSPYDSYLFEIPHDWIITIVTYETTPGILTDCEIRIHHKHQLISPDEGILILPEATTYATIPDVIVPGATVEEAKVIIQISRISDFEIVIGYIVGGVLQDPQVIPEGDTDLLLLGYPPTLFIEGYDWQIEITSHQQQEGTLKKFKIHLTPISIFIAEEIGTPIGTATPIEEYAIINNIGVPEIVESAVAFIEISKDAIDIVIGYVTSPGGAMEEVKSISEGTTDLLSLSYDPSLFNQGYDWQIKIISFEIMDCNLENFEIVINLQTVFESNDIGKIISGLPAEAHAWVRNIDANGYVHNVNAEVIITGTSIRKVYIGYFAGRYLKEEMEIGEGIIDLVTLGFHKNLFKAGFDWRLKVLSYGSTPIMLSSFEIIVEQSPSPISGDSDGDSLDDAFELLYGGVTIGEILSGSSSIGPSPLLLDDDRDGISDDIELSRQYTTEPGLFETSGTTTTDSCTFDTTGTIWSKIEDNFQYPNLDVDPYWYEWAHNPPDHQAKIVNEEYLFLQNTGYVISDIHKWPTGTDKIMVVCKLKPRELGSYPDGAHARIVLGQSNDWFYFVADIFMDKVRVLESPEPAYIHDEPTWNWSPGVSYPYTLSSYQYYYYRFLIDDSSSSVKFYFDDASPDMRGDDYIHEFVGVSTPPTPDPDTWRQTHIRIYKGTDYIAEAHIDDFYLTDGLGAAKKKFKLSNVIVNGFVDSALLKFQSDATGVTDKVLSCRRQSDGQLLGSIQVNEGDTELKSALNDECFTTLSRWFLTYSYDDAETTWNLNTYSLTFKCKTDFKNPDTDGGGIKDGAEWAPVEIEDKTNPTYPYDDDKDFDGDGLNDKFENDTHAYYGAEWDNHDTDGDGLWDGDELFPDKINEDGIVSYIETDPADSDMDDDLLTDYDEVVNATELIFDFETYGVSQWNPTIDLWYKWQHKNSNCPPSQTYGYWCWEAGGPLYGGNRITSLRSSEIDLRYSTQTNMTFWYQKPYSGTTKIFINNHDLVLDYLPRTTGWSFWHLNLESYEGSIITVTMTFHSYNAQDTWTIDDVSFNGYSDPYVRDTDIDGLPDGIEVNKLLSHPIRPNSDGDLMEDSQDFFPIIPNDLPEVNLNMDISVTMYTLTIDFWVNHSTMWDIIDNYTYTHDENAGVYNLKLTPESKVVNLFTGYCHMVFSLVKVGGWTVYPEWLTFTVVDDYGNGIRYNFTVIDAGDIVKADVEGFLNNMGSGALGIIETIARELGEQPNELLDLPWYEILWLIKHYISNPLSSASYHLTVATEYTIVTLQWAPLFFMGGVMVYGIHVQSTWGYARAFLNDTTSWQLPNIPVWYPLIPLNPEMGLELWNVYGVYLPRTTWENIESKSSAYRYSYVINNPEVIPSLFNSAGIKPYITRDRWTLFTAEIIIGGEDALAVAIVDSNFTCRDVWAGIISDLIPPPHDAEKDAWDAVEDITGWDWSVQSSYDPLDPQAAGDGFIYSRPSSAEPGENVLEWSFSKFLLNQYQLPQPSWAVVPTIP